MARKAPTGHNEDHISHENGVGHDHDSVGYQNGVGHEKFHFEQGAPDFDTFVFADPKGHDENHISHENGVGHDHETIGFMNGKGHQKFHDTNDDCEDPFDPESPIQCCEFGEDCIL